MRLHRQSVRLTLLLATALGTSFIVSAQDEEKAGAVPGGRFLYAADDDWDWASPLAAKNKCKLVRYGKMQWSALDWAEEGLDQVRGVLIGIPPNAKKTMTLDELSKLRGRHCSYRHLKQGPGVFERALNAAERPNVIILMQNDSRGVKLGLDKAGIDHLVEFVKRGGRVVVLDDWHRYEQVLHSVVATARKLPAGPPIAEVPKAVRPPAAGEPKRETKPIPKPEAAQELAELNETLKELVPKLGHQKFKVRDAASTDLAALGPEILDLLDDFKFDDPEISTRLAKIRKALRSQSAKGQRMVQSKKERAQQRAAEHAKHLKLMQSSADHLKSDGVSFQLSEALVDGDKMILPVLRIAFPQR